MSLDYNLTEIVDKTINFPADEQGLMHDSLHVMIFGTMTTGVPYLETDADCAEYFHRYEAWTNLNGPLFNRANPAWVDGGPNEGVEPWIPYRLTMQECLNAKGLCTNASHMTRDEFNRQMLAIYWKTRVS